MAIDELDRLTPNLGIGQTSLFAEDSTLLSVAMDFGPGVAITFIAPTRVSDVGSVIRTASRNVHGWSLPEIEARIDACVAAASEKPTPGEVSSLKDQVRRVIALVAERGPRGLPPPLVDYDPDGSIDLLWISFESDKALVLTAMTDEHGRVCPWVRTAEGATGESRLEPTDDDLAGFLAWFQASQVAPSNYALAS